jgi:hypothetical protein
MPAGSQRKATAKDAHETEEASRSPGQPR